MGRIDQATLDYISALRNRMTLAEAISIFSALADAMSQWDSSNGSGQLVLNLEVGIVLISDSPAVVTAKKWLCRSAADTRANNAEEAQRWNCFLTIAKSIGLALAINWLLWHCLALCVPDEKSPYDRTQVA